MNNPTTIDRRDVAHPTNPIGGGAHIEQLRAADMAALPEDAEDSGRATDSSGGRKPASPSRPRNAH